MKMDQNTQKTAREKISRKGGGSKYFKVGGDTKVGGDRAIRGGIHLISPLCPILAAAGEIF